MIKQKGFTLVELLAVIVVLAIILAIAIPSVLNIIKNTRYNSFKSDEELFVKAAKTYLTSNANLLPQTLNDTLKVYLSDLVINSYIENIKDPLTNNECKIDRSYVLVTNTGLNKYSYKPALVCDNYISLDTFDLLKGYGKFAKDTNGNGLADMFSYHLATEFSLNNNIQTFKTKHGIYFQKNNFAKPVVIGNKYYIHSKTKSSSATTYFRLENATGDSVYHSGNNNFNILSGVFQMTTTAGSIILYDATANVIINTKDWYALDLTDIYGSLNEPIKDLVDKIISNMT